MNIIDFQTISPVKKTPLEKLTFPKHFFNIHKATTTAFNISNFAFISIHTRQQFVIEHHRFNFAGEIAHARVVIIKNPICFQKNKYPRLNYAPL